MNARPSIPGKYMQAYTINTKNLVVFEKVKTVLVELEGVEDVLYDDQLSPPEMILLSDGKLSDERVQQAAASLGYPVQPKHFLIL
ncbi:MAG: hypothetical protein ACFB15_22530 [Cyclobacteriaceae bacterium]